MADTLSIDRGQLQKLADLARLHVPAERQLQVLGHLQRIVGAFDALRSLPTEEVAGLPTARLRLRPDELSAPMPLEAVLANAPQTAGGMFVVPRVVDA